MGELAKILGLGAPVAAAGAIYWLFSFLDKKASDEANHALASWTKGESYNQVDLGVAVIGAFDHLYSRPLFTWKAFSRSAMLSLFVSLIYVVFIIPSMVEPIDLRSVAVLVQLLAFALLIVMGDYLSLFVIRKCLQIATRSVLRSILMALVFGYVAISALIAVYRTASPAVFDMYDMFTGITHNVSYWRYALDFVWTFIYIYFPRAFLEVLDTYMLTWFAPAFLVHLWLPLFLIGVLLNRGLSAFCRVAGLAQRFIKHGDEHPFDAIGMVAATLVFVVTMIWQIAVHFSAPEISQIPT